MLDRISVGFDGEIPGDEGVVESEVLAFFPDRHVIKKMTM
jgi:hypothetical protein